MHDQIECSVVTHTTFASDIYIAKHGFFNFKLFFTKWDWFKAF